MDFRHPSQSEIELISQFWSNEAQSLKKNSKSFFVFSVCCSAILIFVLYYLSTELSQFTNEDKWSLIIGGSIMALVIISMVAFSVAELCKTNRNSKPIYKPELVCNVMIKNVRFVMNYDYDWHHGFADVCDSDGSIIAENVLMPTDFAFMIEMLGVNETINALIFKTRNGETLFGVPTGGDDNE